MVAVKAARVVRPAQARRRRFARTSRSASSRLSILILNKFRPQSSLLQLSMLLFANVAMPPPRQANRQNLNGRRSCLGLGQSIAESSTSAHLARINCLYHSRRHRLITSKIITKVYDWTWNPDFAWLEADDRITSQCASEGAQFEL